MAIGNKSVETIILEKQFEAIVRALGGDCLYEYKIFKRPPNGYELVHPFKVDFVVSLKGEDSKPTYRTFTGVELKNDIYDLMGAYGKNFFSFVFNYLLVPERISERAAKYMSSVVEYKHVGILVLCDNGELIMRKKASAFLEDDKDFDTQYMSAIENSEDELQDAIDCLINHTEAAEETNKEERERELCRSNYAAQLEGLGYNADGTPK